MLFIAPCLPRLRPKPPTERGWQHEVKFDGYRIQIHKTSAAGGLLYSKNGMDFGGRFPRVAACIEHLPAKSVVLDAELVANNANGAPDFYALQMRRAAPEDLSVWVFDMLEHNGTDMRSMPLSRRRLRLAGFMAKIDDLPFYLSETFDDPVKLLVACEKRSMEGIVSKRMSSPYRSGDTGDWIKVKCEAWKETNKERGKLFQ
jgi:bifunctional non-homologous end joining protein LigD